jgi:3-oxoacyl-[acyl-carrier protein] reductase
MDLGITNKTAIVTGGARGIGAAIAERFAREGARVVIADIDAEAGEKTAQALRNEQHDATAIATDLTSSAGVANLVEATLERFGGIHILVNNAGFQRDALLVQMSEQDWDSVVDVVMKAAFLTSRAVMPQLVEQRWGRIVNISSRAHFGNPGQANYASAKAGILGLTRALALEEGRWGVTVNAVAPGFVETEAVTALPHFSKIREQAVTGAPLRRTGSPEEIADTVVFLASERASFITGETVHVTGGRFG